MILRGRDLSTFELRVAGYQFPELDYDLWMDLEVDSNDPRVAAEDLRRDLERFPPRAGGAP